MRREEKSDLISALQSSLKDANGVFVIENHGLTVKEFEALRNELRPLVSVFKVVKNRLLAQVENRTDAGALWENFIIAERLKRNSYNGSIAQYWFWRTQQQKEIDYLEEENGQLNAYEFKWNDKKANVRVPESFSKAYPDATFHIITPKNADEFLL